MTPHARRHAALTVIAGAAAALLLGAHPGAAPQPADSVQRTLAERFGLTAADRNALSGGYEAARALPAAHDDGVSAIGAIWIAARPDTYLRWAEEFADFDRGSSVQAVQKLSSPPVASDFDGLRLSAEELRDLARCRVGACALQLDADSIHRVAAIDWRRKDASERATDVVRSFMLDVALRYTAEGNAGLPHYHDAKKATDVEQNLAGLLDDERAAGRIPAPLLAFLHGYPRAPLPAQSASYVYWTTNTFGLKPTTRLNHTVVSRGAADDQIIGIIATKQLYASHYFHGALEMRYVVANPALDDRFALVMVTRARSDGLTGVTGAVIGGAIRRRALQSLRGYLRFTRDMVEKRQRAGGSRNTPGGRRS